MKKPLLNTAFKRTSKGFTLKASTLIFIFLCILFLIATKPSSLKKPENAVGKEFLTKKPGQDASKLESEAREIKNYHPTWEKNIKDPQELLRSKFFAKLVLEEVDKMDGKYDFNGALIFGLQEDQKGFFKFLGTADDRPLNSFIMTIRNLQTKLNIRDTIAKLEDQVLDKIGRPNAKLWWREGPSEMLYFLRCYNILNQYIQHIGTDLHMFFITPAPEIMSDANHGQESLLVKRTLQAAEALLGNRGALQASPKAQKELEKIKVPQDAIIWVISETASTEDEAYSMHRKQHLPDTDMIKPPDDLVDAIVAAMLEISITDLEPSPEQLQELT